MRTSRCIFFLGVYKTLRGTVQVNSEAIGAIAVLQNLS